MKYWYHLTLLCLLSLSFLGCATGEPSTKSKFMLQVANTSTENTVSLVWAPVEGASSYTIQREEKTDDNNDNDSNSMTSLFSTTQASFTDTELLPNTSYHYTILAIKSGMVIAEAKCSSSTRSMTSLHSTVVVNEFNRVAISWDKLSHATHYTIQREEGTPTSKTENHHEDNDISAETTYHYTIQAFKDKTLLATDQVSVTTPGIAPLHLTLSRSSACALQLSWENLSQATQYQLYANDQLFSNVHSPFTLDHLTGNTTYSIELVALQGETPLKKESLSASTLNTTLPVTLSSLTRNSLSLFWSEFPQATNYTLFLNHQAVTSQSTTFLTLNTLNPNTPYTFSVVAYDKDLFPLTESTMTECITPDDIQFASPRVTQNSIFCQWSPIAGAHNYSVSVNGVPIKLVESTSYSFTNLQPQRQYHLSVKAYDSKKTIISEGEIQVTTLNI